jgi:3-oxoacyl-[acyl-carrier-protein] synthase-3
VTTEQSKAPQGYKTPVGILGVGHFVPEEIVTNHDLAKFVDTTDEWIVGRTGIRARRRARPDQATSDLAIEAARQALAAANTRAEELDLIIVATMTPDCPMPATASIVQHRLGASKAGGFDLNIACSGFVYALVTGAQFVTSGTYQRVLVIGADCMTRLMNWKDRSTCVLFGDGAGAVVLGPVQPGCGILGVHTGVNGAGGPSLTVKAGGSRLPSWSEGINPGEFFLQMEGPEVFRFAVSVMGEAAIKALDNAGLEPEEVALFIPHQANARIIEASRKRLGLPHQRVFSNVEHYGNTSCGSVPIALSEALEQNRIKDGDLVVLVGFGGGLSWASVALRWGGFIAKGT